MSLLRARAVNCLHGPHELSPHISHRAGRMRRWVSGWSMCEGMLGWMSGCRWCGTGEGALGSEPGPPRASGGPGTPPGSPAFSHVKMGIIVSLHQELPSFIVTHPAVNMIPASLVNRLRYSVVTQLARGHTRSTGGANILRKQLPPTFLISRHTNKLPTSCSTPKIYYSVCQPDRKK